MQCERPLEPNRHPRGTCAPRGFLFARPRPGFPGGACVTPRGAVGRQIVSSECGSIGKRDGERGGGTAMPEKRSILMALVGNPRHTASQHNALRPLLKAFKDALKGLAGAAYEPDWWYAAAPLGPGPDNGDLQDAIRAEIKRRGRPHVIVPIASGAARAAKAVVDQDYSTDRIPIVFTVVSDPVGEGIHNGIPRITGVSRNLIKTAPDAVDRFAALLGRPCHIYCCFRPGLHQAECAWGEITARPPAQVTLHREDIPGNDCNSFVHTVNQIPPRVDSQRTGLFMIPDDLVGRCAPEVVRAAHGRGIPTFFQQLEWVCPGNYSARGPFAPGGYGVTAEWVGKETAAYVDPVIRDPNPDAANRDPLYPSKYQFWVNEQVAHGLGLNKTPEGASPCEPGPARQAPPKAAKAAPAAPARVAAPKVAPPKPPRKVAKRRPAAKGVAAEKGRTTKTKKTAARGKGASRRGARRGRR